jgi:hypothetical protein
MFVVVVIRSGRVIGRATDPLPRLQAHAALEHLTRKFPNDSYMVVPANATMRA